MLKEKSKKEILEIIKEKQRKKYEDNKTKYRLVNVNFTLKQYDELKKIAEQQGENSVNMFIKKEVLKKYKIE
jgi:hypothetical protein